MSDGILNVAGEMETQEAPFNLWDCAGYSSSCKIYTCNDLGHILDGHVPNGFDFSQPISPQAKDYITAQDLANRVHCICFVVFCAAIYEWECTLIKTMKECAMDRGELYF